VKEAEKYEDKGVFRYGLTYVQHHEAIYQRLTDESALGNSFAFPSKEFGLILINDKEQDLKQFKVYDVFRD